MANWPFWNRKPELRVAREAEKRIGPVLDRKNFLSMECAHVFWFFRLA